MLHPKGCSDVDKDPQRVSTGALQTLIKKGQCCASRVIAHVLYLQRTRVVVMVSAATALGETGPKIVYTVLVCKVRVLEYIHTFTTQRP